MKTPIVLFVCLLLSAAGLAAENQQQFDEIDKYIAQQRCNIENYYQSQLIELNQRAQSEIRLLEVADKALYTGAYDKIYANLAAQTEVAKVVLNIDSYGYRVPWYLEGKTEEMLQLKDSSESFGDSGDYFKNAPSRFAVAYSLLAERKSRILENLAWEAAKLQRQKEYALTIGLTQLESRLREDTLEPAPQAAKGMVAGILYSQDKPCAIIGGKIVHEGDTIGGVTVVKIHQDKVQFAKKSRNWTQEVRQKPEGYW